MPTWWGRKSCKNKDDNNHNHNNSRGISTDRDIKTCVVAVDPPLTPTRASTPRCSREFAGASSGFSGFDSDSTEKKCHPLPRPLLSPVSIHQDHNYAKQPLSRAIKSPSRENIRAIASLPVSPCSSPLRQLGPAYKSCFLSPPHPSYTFPGQDSGYNLAEFAASPFRVKKDTMMEPSSFRAQTPNSPLRSRLV